MHYCRVCPTLKFPDEKCYLLHIRDSHDGKAPESKMCEACGKTFRTTSQLNCHKKSKCGTEKNFVCKECGKKLMSASSLHNHMKIHNEKANFMCRFCTKLFHFIGQLKVHEKIHTKVKDFICQECGKGFSYRQSLITHVSIHSGIKPYNCDDCGCSFSCVSNLLKHKKMATNSCGVLPTASHTVQNPMTKIKILMNTPDTSRLKKMEMKRRLEEKISRLDNVEHIHCVDDSKSIDKNEVEMKENLTVNQFNNISIKISKENIQYIHQIDQEGLGNEVFLGQESHDQKTHKPKHIKDYMYICETCGTIFKHKFLLETHQKSNCGKLLIHQCKVCEKGFSNKHTLANHIKIHTVEKRLSCKFCPKTFRWKGQVKIHERSHTGEKPFTCLFCPSSFTYRESLLIHSYKHTGNKPYVCKCCGWRFSCVGNFNKHKKTHFDSCGLWYREYDMRMDKK